MTRPSLSYLLAWAGARVCVRLYTRPRRGKHRGPPRASGNRATLAVAKSRRPRKVVSVRWTLWEPYRPRDASLYTESVTLYAGLLGSDSCEGVVRLRAGRPPIAESSARPSGLGNPSVRAHGILLSWCPSARRVVSRSTMSSTRPDVFSGSDPRSRRGDRVTQNAFTVLGDLRERIHNMYRITLSFVMFVCREVLQFSSGVRRSRFRWRLMPMMRIVRYHYTWVYHSTVCTVTKHRNKKRP